MTRNGLHFICVALACVALVGPGRGPAAAQGTPGRGSNITPGGTCDLDTVSRAKREFLHLSAQRRFDPERVGVDDLRAASLTYIALTEPCYQPHEPHARIDEGGITLTPVPGSAQFGVNGRKWGLGSPFASVGVDANGPRAGGGTVTYGFMANDIGGLEVEGGAPGLNVAISSLPTFAPCFIDEITTAFALWSAVANIQFELVEDNGTAFNASGASADIRIGAHVFDGPAGALAHGYYPPPNGGSAAGDIHFDIAESWSCETSSGFDLGVVAAHEIGHAIGLEHEFRAGPDGRVALMNPNYNPFVTFPLGDDINGAENLYGSAVGNSPDAVIRFDGSVWIFDYGVGWSELTTSGAEQVVAGDLDGNGIDELIVDLGGSYGVWIHMNRADWFQLHEYSPSFMSVGDLDASGRDDIVADFEGLGVWQWMNNGWWTELHPENARVFAVGNLDDLAGDDVVLTFPGLGVWRWMNNAFWELVHEVDADQLVVGDFDATPWDAAANADDLVLNVPDSGVYMSLNRAPLFQLSSTPAAHLTSGDVSGDGRDELIIDGAFGEGLWVVDVLSEVWHLHPLGTDGLIVGDLDGNGQGDILVDFGEEYGIWIFVNNASWLHLTSMNPHGFAIADLD